MDNRRRTSPAAYFRLKGSPTRTTQSCNSLFIDSEAVTLLLWMPYMILGWASDICYILSKISPETSSCRGAGALAMPWNTVQCCIPARPVSIFRQISGTLPPVVVLGNLRRFSLFHCMQAATALQPVRIYISAGQLKCRSRSPFLPLHSQYAHSQYAHSQPLLPRYHLRHRVLISSTCRGCTQLEPCR